MNSLGERVDYLRRKDKLSYNDLALVLEGITSDGVRKAIVNDRLKEDQLDILSKTYHWNLDWIKQGGDFDKKNTSPQEELAGLDKKEIISYIFNNREEFQKVSMYKMLIELELNQLEISEISNRVGKVEATIKNLTS
jgi:hypothetical protein